MPKPTYVVKLKPHEAPRQASLLGQLDIELTERCNNACIHCCINQPEGDASARAREMDTAFVKNVLTQAADLGCLTVRFTGGEPLLRDDFAELYLFARRLGIQVILFTNARRITPEIAQLLARIPPAVWRVILVDDASRDGTAEVMRAWRDPRGQCLRSGVPLGVGGAILLGYRHALEAGSRVAVVVAADAQMDLGELGRVAEPALRDALARRARDTGRAFRAGAALSHWETHLAALAREAV